MQKLFLLALCVAAATAFACPPGFCSTVKCNAVTACNGRITKGMCGCCDTCIVYLREGDACNPSPLLGSPEKAECGLDTVCSKRTGTCIKPVSLYEDRDCEKHRATAKASGLLGTFIPRCDADGTYSAIQCVGSVCKCVSKDGEVIKGFQSHVGHSSFMDCNCARDQFEYTKSKLVGRMFNCESNGNYKRLQCLGSVCFCADKFGKQIGNSAVHISESNSLNC